MRYFDGLMTADLETLRRWRNSREVFRHIRQRTLLSDVHQAGWIEEIARNDRVRMMAVRLGERPPAAKLVNVVGITSIDWVNRVGEISIIHDEIEDLSGLCWWGFEVLNLVRLEAVTYTTARGAFVDEAGFEHEGTKRGAIARGGIERTDADLWGLLRDEFTYEEETHQHLLLLPTVGLG